MNKIKIYSKEELSKIRNYEKKLPSELKIGDLIIDYPYGILDMCENCIDKPWEVLELEPTGSRTFVKVRNIHNEIIRVDIGNDKQSYVIVDEENDY